MGGDALDLRGRLRGAAEGVAVCKGEPGARAVASALADAEKAASVWGKSTLVPPPGFEAVTVTAADDSAPDAAPPDDAPLALAAGDVLGRALALVTGDRAAQHGDKMDNMANIARLAQAWLDIRADPGAPLSAVDAAVMMILVKLARTQSGAFNPDDWIDAAGYCAVGGEVAARMRVGLDEASGRGGADPARDLRDLLALTEDDGPRHGLILPGVGLTPGAEG